MPIEAFENFNPRIHPEAWVHAGAHLIGDVAIEAGASIWPGVVLRGDHGAVRIGARTSIQDGSVAHGTEGISRTVIGSGVTVGHRTVLHGCQVGDHCLVGMGSILLDNAELGEWCFLGAGSLVTPGKKFPPRSFLLGSPAKRIREVTAQEMQSIEYSVQAYQDLIRRHRGG